MKRKLWIFVISLAVVIALAGVWLLDIPNWKTLDEQLLTHLQSAAVVYDRDGNEAFSLYGAQKRRNVSIDELPAHVPQAFVAAEDQRFYSHNGVDVRRIFGAALNNIKSGSLGEGASTITQQLIKLTHLSSEKTFRRKVTEARLAIQAERVYTKDQILEMYMNVAYFGSGAYGIDMAAETYFDKRAAELTVAEAALLAGLLKSPNSYSPKNSPEKALQRRDYVLGEMLECGYITQDGYDAAKASELRLAEDTGAGVTGWYRDAVISEATEILQISPDELLGGGYRIDTALDMSMQRAADACMADETAFPAQGVEGALIAVDPLDGGVLAVCGGRSDETRMALNRALDSRRQPGSAIKPISVYAAAIDAMGYLPSDFIDDTQQVFDDGYMPRNAGDNYYGLVTLRTALSKSLNVATVALADEIDVAAMRNYARRFGIPVDNDDASLSFALGSMTYGVTPAELAGAYSSLANGGTGVDVHLITQITDSTGAVVYRHQAQGERIIAEETAAMLTDMLTTAAQQGSAKALSSAGVPVAGKTGTVSQEGGTRDVWTIAYTPDACISVWMGYDSADEGIMPESTSGSGYAARMAAAWLGAVSDELSGAEFAVPDTLVRAQLDRISLEEEHVALLAGEHTPDGEAVSEIFPADRLPAQTSARYEAPGGVLDAELDTNGLGMPVITFTAAQSGMEYMVMRHQDGQIVCVATLSGDAGEKLSYTDGDASLLSAAEYQIVARQMNLYGKGTLLTDAESVLLRFEPLMAKIGGIGGDGAPEVAAPEDTAAPEALFGG